MMFARIVVVLFTLVVLAIGSLVSARHDDHESITADANADTQPEFDIVLARVVRFGSTLLFHQVVDGEAGALIPNETGQLAGADVFSYVWPTSLDSSVVGFESEQGILALAVTSHPDFDDTPLYDENNDGDPTNDGALWHSHWVVLVEDATCGDAGLKVKDIPEGESPALPDTWPELPILIDSPGYDLELVDAEVVVEVPHADVGYAEAFNFDGVTAGLRVNANVHDPLLCVTGIDDIASGDLSLPGVAR